MAQIQTSLFKNTEGTVVISASKRTDIPAFYYNWLQTQLKNKRVTLQNPIYPTKKSEVDLSPENIHSIVLWSKNFNKVCDNPMFLDNYNLYFQYTINNYSKKLEPNVPEYNESIRVLDKLLKKYSPEQFNIRFDPIIISTAGEIVSSPENPENARLLCFERLCADLSAMGATACRVTTSYLSLYKHVRTRLLESKVDFIDYTTQQQLIFFTQMSLIAQKYNIQLYSCADEILEHVDGIKKGHCIDGELLEKLFGGKVSRAKASGQRESCGCTKSTDIGIYSSNTKQGMHCKHKCTYCYAM